ncbi:MAG: TolC family protein [Deltaproteobacteria bacterium]|nr:TolC family protein [Deltaproteobacteria bacterium]
MQTARRWTFLRWLTPVAVLAAAATPAAAEPLTPDQALARAATRSPELRATLHDLEAAKASMDGEAMARDPRLTAGVHATHSTRDSIDASVGVRTTTDLGTVIDVGVDAAFDSGPSQSATVGIDVRQPLLRGAGQDSVLAALRQARIARTQSEIERDRIATQVAAAVLEAYWEVWFAAQALDVERAQLALTERQLDEVRKKVDVLKTLPAIEALRLESQRASQVSALSQAEASLEQAQIGLARLLGVSYAEAGAIVAAAAPTTAADVEPLAALIGLAEAESYELRIRRLDLEANRIGLADAQSASRPKLDLVGALSAGLLWDDQFDGFEWRGGRPGIIAMIGLEGELPFGRGSEDARLDGARARQRAAEARYEAQREELGAQVARTRRALVQAIQAATLSETNARVARELAEREADKLRLGTAVLTDLVIAQQSARDAELQLLRARVAVETTRNTLDELTGTLLARLALTPN